MPLFVSVLGCTLLAPATPDEAAAPLIAGTAPLLSPYTLVLAGAGLVFLAMIRTKRRQHSE